MGHIRLGVLPRTRNWRQVIELLEDTPDASAIASATLSAASKNFNRTAEDPGLAYIFWLLTQLPLAAKNRNFAKEVDQLGIKLSPEAGTIELVGSLTLAIDKYLNTNRTRTDVSEMAQMVANETLSSACLEATQSLFGLRQYDMKSDEEKRKLLCFALSNCILKDATLIPTYNKPLSLIAEGLISERTRGQRDSNVKELKYQDISELCRLFLTLTPTEYYVLNEDVRRLEEISENG